MTDRLVKCYGICGTKHKRSVMKQIKNQNYCPECYPVKLKEIEEAEQKKKNSAPCKGTCGKTYDRRKMKKFSTKLYCESCYKVKEQEDRDRKALYEYVARVFNMDFPDGALRKQIKTFREREGYSYKNIHFTVHYIVEIKKIPLTKAYGIGLVGNYHQEMIEYYKALNEKKENTVFQKPRVVTITMKPPVFHNNYREKKLINMEELLK